MCVIEIFFLLFGKLLTSLINDAEGPAHEVARPRGLQIGVLQLVRHAAVGGEGQPQADPLGVGDAVLLVGAQATLLVS